MSIDLLPLDDSYEDVLHEYGDILREYCQLASQKTLSEADVDRLTEILTIAESDNKLTFLINEADHFLAHQLGLLDIDDRNRYENQQAQLGAKLGLQRAANKHSNPLPVGQRVFCSEALGLRGWMVYYCL